MRSFIKLICIGIVFLSIWLCAVIAQADDFVPDTPEKVESLVMAIYKAEGGKSTKYPFGIKSVPCRGYEGCKRVCRNTVVNNISRWRKAVAQGDKRDYLTFLWHRYCPPKAHELNGNWLKNVKYFLNKG